jgi:hypothetical protein
MFQTGNGIFKVNSSPVLLAHANIRIYFSQNQDPASFALHSFRALKFIITYPLKQNIDFKHPS